MIAMERRRSVSLLFVVALLGNAFALPFDARLTRGLSDNELDSTENGALHVKDLTPAGSEKRPTREDSENVADSEGEASKMNYDTSTNKVEFATPVFDSDEDDDDFDEPIHPSPPGGSNIFSLLRLANAIFPSSGGSSSGANQSKTPSDQPASPFWTLKMDILRALLQFGTSLIGSASSASSNGSNLG